ncbi:hypothetical protein H9P43_001649 [Blastocladiella emersonii ATCC 22665]|nr:hypothetical protein H9P43_001649 [Blastocladiella emersonii ATCC 22665]
MMHRGSLAVGRDAPDMPSAHRESVVRNLTGAKGTGRRMSLRKLSFGVREIGYFRDLCHHVQANCLLLRKETSLRRLQEINKLRNSMDQAEDEELMDHFNTEAMAAIINQGVRTSLLKSRIMSKIGDEKELGNLIQAHKDEFLQQIWNRRLITKRELRTMFRHGAGIMHNLGDLISRTTLDLVNATERNNCVTYLKDGIAWGFVGNDDVTGILSRKVFLVGANDSEVVFLHSSRLDFGLQPNRPDPLAWGCVRATRGALRAHAFSRPIELELVQSALRTVEQARDTGDTTTSFMHLLARTADLVHPGHFVLADVIAYPLYAQGVLRHKLLALGYDVQEDAAAAAATANGQAPAAAGVTGATTNAASNPRSATFAANVLYAMARKLQHTCRFYFEFTVRERTAWRVGFDVFRPGAAPGTSDSGYPGMLDESMGISFDGNVYFMGLPTRYMEGANPLLLGRGSASGSGSNDSLRSSFAQLVSQHELAGLDATGSVMCTYGVLVDVAAGTIALVFDGQVLDIAFGDGAEHYAPDDQTRQVQLIQTQLLVPMFALNGASAADAVDMRVNFGLYPFAYLVDAYSLNEYLATPTSRPDHAASILDDANLTTTSGAGTGAGGLGGGAGGAGGALGGDASSRDRAVLPEEDERVQLALEKNHFRASIASEEDRSWSQFPPSVYKRSLAATKIQRAWRVFRGRRWRRALLEAQTAAAIRIQRMARRKLNRIRAVKNAAAHIIQRNWRIKLYLGVALLRLRYNRPITELHQAARTIQNKFRDWAHFRNSPFASRFRKKLELLTKAAVRIQQWWRPLYQRLQEAKTRNKQYHAATTIQRVWRGYMLRSVLRPDIRARLSALGKSLVRHRTGLLQLHAAIRIQSMWREIRMRRVRAQKIRTRHAAATRLQALWKGYWVRSHIHLRFDYGESVFLTAVCKNLRNAHFILKMYKPCGIVCPKRER